MADAHLTVSGREHRDSLPSEALSWEAAGRGQQLTVRFESTAKVLADCMLNNYMISLCSCIRRQLWTTSLNGAHEPKYAACRQRVGAINGLAMRWLQVVTTHPGTQ